MVRRSQFAKKDAESDLEDFSVKPSKGKRKKTKIAERTDAKTPLLQAMLDIPVDILLEIFKHVELVDLMHLSRTSKFLRSVLMNRNSISVWKQVVANDGLPQCPKDFNEPQLAELIFGRRCDWCGRNVSGQEILWVSRVRACKRCIDLAWSHEKPIRGYPSDLAQYLPSVVIKQRKYFDADLDRQWHDQYAAMQSEEEKLEWLEARVTERSAIFVHAMACQSWFNSRLETHVKMRKAMIIERLKKRGWEEELDKLTKAPTDQLPEVVKACQSELTEPILAALDDILEKFMEDVKAARLVREKKEFFKHMLHMLRDIFKEYSDTLPANHILPNVADIYFHPVVNKAMSGVESQEVLEETLTRIRPSLVEIIDDCQKLLRQEVIDLVIADYTANSKSFDLSVLTHASTLFYCRACTCDLTLDQSVVHSCTSADYYFRPLSEEMRAVHSAIFEVTNTHRIRSTISFSRSRLESLTSVLHACGIDPNTTVTDMRAIDPIIECLDCGRIDRGRVTMNWLSVPKHFASPVHRTINVVVLDDSEAEIVRARMLEQYQMGTERSNDHVCVQCRDRGGSMTLMRHVKQYHHIDSPIYGQHVIVAPEKVDIRLVFSLWPPRL